MMLKGKRALITGGTSGIGLAVARMFIANGARVAITGRREEHLDRLRAEFGPAHLAIRNDASDVGGLPALYQQIAETFGGLDILFANAGITGTGASLENTTEKMFDDVYNLNVRGVFFCVQKALPLLTKGSSIILNASMAPRMGRPNSLLYASSKAAVRTMARNISAELVGREIRCNAISPGPIETELWESFGADERQVAAVKAKRAATIPVGRFGTAEEVAQLVTFLASDASRFIVAADLVIDGGLSEIRL